ncbi:MAG: hypothetical protein U9P44_01905, partial [archaeon]|nr:hypothetical protein [archaeon]
MNLKQVFIISFLILFCIAFIFHLPRNNKDPVREDNTGISIYFCQQDSCSTYMSRLIKSSNTSVRCAFFDLELENIINTIKNTDYKLVIDK